MTIPEHFRRSYAIVGLLLAILVPSAGHAGAQKSETLVATAKPLPRIEYQKFQLKNGLDVILYQDHRLPLVAVNIWYHVGPANERAGRTGFAHLFEHMLFEGSKHVGPK